MDQSMYAPFPPQPLLVQAVCASIEGGYRTSQQIVVVVVMIIMIVIYYNNPIYSIIIMDGGLGLYI